MGTGHHASFGHLVRNHNRSVSRGRSRTRSPLKPHGFTSPTAVSIGSRSSSNVRMSSASSRSSTRTRTKTKTKSLDPIDSLVSSTIVVDLRKESKKAARKEKHKVAHWFYQQQNLGFINGVAGQQAFLGLANYVTPSQCVVSSGSGYGGSENFTALRDLNPYLKDTGSGLFGAGGVAATDRFKLNRLQIELDFTNASLFSNDMQVYLVQCIKSTKTNFGDLWINGLKDLAIGASNIVLPTTAAPTPTAGAIVANAAGIRIKDGSQLWKKYFKIVASKDITMGAGATQKIKWEVLLDKTINCEVQTQSITDGIGMLSRQSLHIFVIAKGALGDDISAGQPMYSTVKIPYASQIRYLMSSVDNNAGRLSTGYMADQMVTESVVSNVKIPDEFTATIIGNILG